MPIYRLDQHSPKLAERTYVAPTAVLIGQVILHASANIWFGAVLRGDNEPITVGEQQYSGKQRAAYRRRRTSDHW